MNNSFFQNAKYILSHHINEKTRVLDLMCGENVYTPWLNSEGTAKVIPLSPDVLEHIKSENPFVAYNNFINDTRLLPTQGGKADVVILMGPLYSMQNTESRTKTLNEVKRLLSENGKVITLCNQNPLVPLTPALTPQSEKQAQELFYNTEFESAGFEINSITELPIDSCYDDGYNTNQYIAVASVRTVPQPAVSPDAVPPEIQLPKSTVIVQKTSNGLITYYRQPFAPAVTKDNFKEFTTLPSSARTDYRKVRRSIQPSLQHKIVKPIFPSIDNSIQPPSFVTEKAFTKIKHTALLNTVGEKKIFKSIESKLQEKRRPRVAPSIDSALQGSYIEDNPPFISMADLDISAIQYRLNEIRHRLPIIPEEILLNYNIGTTETKPESPIQDTTKPIQPAPATEKKSKAENSKPEVVNEEKKICKSIDTNLTEKQKPKVKKSIDTALQGVYSENAEDTPPTVKAVKPQTPFLQTEKTENIPDTKTEPKQDAPKRLPPPPSQNFGLNIMPSIDSRLVFRKNRSKLLNGIQKSIDNRLIVRKDKDKIVEKFTQELNQKKKNAELRKVRPSIDSKLNKKAPYTVSLSDKHKGKNLNKT